MEGTMFDTLLGEVQVDVWFVGPGYATEDDMFNVVAMANFP